MPSIESTQFERFKPARSAGSYSEGESYWRSIEHVLQSPEAQKYFDSEFPGLAGGPPSDGDRRQFIRLLAASMALAGITSTGCRRWPMQEIRPHTSRPEGSMPGVAQYYATCFELDGAASGLLVKSYDGRPIKVEGNPAHGFSKGAASGLAQASVLDLYDPDRSRQVIERRFSSGSPDQPPAVFERTWLDFRRFAGPHFQSLKRRQGEGLAILYQPTASPSWERMRLECAAAMPKVRWFHYQPLHRDNEMAGIQLAFGQPLRPQYELDQAKIIACFDADLLGDHAAQLKLARDWSMGRKSADRGGMNRLYAIESGMSLTGAASDERLPVRPSVVPLAAAYVAYRLRLIETAPEGLSQRQIQFLDTLIEDLEANRTAGLVVAGSSQDAEVHRLVQAINDRLGNLGHTLSFTREPLAPSSDCQKSLKTLSDLLQGNVIDTLLILNGNPVYDAPADAPLNLAATAAGKLTTIHLSLYDNETSQQCQWSLPAAHYLECWGDGRAWDGTYGIQQPLILPLFGGKSPIELLALVQGNEAANGLPMVRATFDKLFASEDQRGWERTLHDGVQPASQFEVIHPPAPQVNPSVKFPPQSVDFEFRFVADAKLHDGRFANNGWLQELPDPLTKLTWDNAALMSQQDADGLGITTGDVLRIGGGVGEPQVEIAAFVMPGHAAGCITLPLGYGRTRGHIASGVGVNVYPLRRAESGARPPTFKIANSGRRYQLASTQEHHLVASVADFALRKRLGAKGQAGLIVHEGLLSEYQKDPHSVHGDAHAVLAAPLFDPPSNFDSPHKWAMAIDLNSCIGCGACVLACQAENNIPIVGKANVARNREMHWLRIDRYFKGEIDEPDVVHLPMACAHCENAPCEQVCPVAATVHDAEGLNGMIYNRCIGTRYCANNCPYKVRRFNYFDYQAADPRTPAKPWLAIPDLQQAQEISPLKQMVFNPDVTVRMRGVMEKCTYCVQRISAARITARNEHAQGLREADLVADGELQTACQATCPTQAIVFGNLNDPNSAVSQARNNDRSYELLEELNLKARTTYMAKIRNRVSQP